MAMTNLVGVTETNGVALAAQYENEADTLLEVWRASRDRVVSSLEAKRTKLAAKLAEVDAQIAEVRGGGALKPKRGRPAGVGARGPLPMIKTKVLDFLRANPGATTAEIVAATDVKPTYLSHMVAKGAVRRVGTEGMTGRWAVGI